MKRFLLYLLPGILFTIPAITSFAQVSISSDNSLPDPSAMLDVRSADRGVLIPRMTHSQIAAISGPAEGLLVFCTDCGTGALSVFVGGQWNALEISCLSPSAPEAAEHQATRTQITWNWEAVPYATGYKWSTDNVYETATDLFTATTFTESGLSSNTSYTRYVWAYNQCGGSVVTEMTQTTALPVLPVLTTSAVTGIGLTGFTSGGNITFDGDAAITSRGVCWGITAAPDISGSHTDDGTSTGVFTSTPSGLSEGAVYYVRAYATNAAGTAYGNEVRFSTYISDVDGNSYRTVLIGSQLWMAEHLRTTKYSDGSAISYHTGFRSISPEYAWYLDNITYKIPYGALYNFPAVSTGKLCPTGWHVASDAEWTTLTDLIGGLGVAGGKLKETGTVHWYSPNTGATDEYGFTLLPAGATQQIAYGYISLGYATCIWTSNQGVTRNVSNDKADMVKSSGYYDYVKNSVRCMKNQ